MRLHPTMVPRPKAMATDTLTQSSMNLVESSISFLKANRLEWVSLSNFTAPFLSSRRMDSEARYISLRTLATASIGTRAREP